MNNLYWIERQQTLSVQFSQLSLGVDLAAPPTTERWSVHCLLSRLAVS